MEVGLFPSYIAIAEKETRREIRLPPTHRVYVPDMALHFDYYFTAVAPVEFRGWRVVDYSRPNRHQITGFADFPILCQSLAEPYQTCQQYLDFARLVADDVVLDLGCYSGLTAIAFSKAVGAGGRVIALEPDPGNLATCRVNIAEHRRVNGLENITVRSRAIGDHNGVMSFSAEGSMGSAATSIVGDQRAATINVEAVTLDQLALDHSLTRVAFVKMDIEGLELPVLRSAAAFLNRYRPRLLIEPHYVAGVINTSDIVACLEGYGYACSVIEQTGVALPLVTAVPPVSTASPS